MIVRRPRSVRDDQDDEVLVVGGHADGMAPVYDLEADEQEEILREVREQIARKKPAGFAPWPEQVDAVRHLRAAS